MSEVTAHQANRRALIVGMGGIGSAVAQRLAALGFEVIGTYFRNAPADEVQAVQMDVTDPSSVERAFAEAGPIDTVVTTTGHRHDLEFFTQQDPSVTQDIVATELLGPMNVVRVAVAQFAGFGRIVVIGSDSGKAGTLGDAASSAARAGLMGFVRSIARETSRDDVTINIVSPGPTDTELLQKMLKDDGLKGKVMNGTLKAVLKGRPARAVEISRAVEYFVSPDAGFTTGQVLSVSGGLTM